MLKVKRADHKLMISSKQRYASEIFLAGLSSVSLYRRLVEFCFRLVFFENATKLLVVSLLFKLHSLPDSLPLTLSLILCPSLSLELFFVFYLYFILQLHAWSSPFSASCNPHCLCFLLLSSHSLWTLLPHTFLQPFDMLHFML